MLRSSVDSGAPVDSVPTVGSGPPAGSGPGEEAFTLAPARTEAGDFVLCRLSRSGRVEFEVPLPGRAHGVVRRPASRHAIVFARRPGRFALVIDRQTGRVLHTFEPPADRHFYGHGVFTRSGDTLFVTENAFEERDGRVGVYDARDRYRRLGEFASGGIGPHDIDFLSDGRTLVIANGGIATHPDLPRRKLNIETMAPSLAFFSDRGRLAEAPKRLGEDRHKLSIRHLTVLPDGRVAAALQNEDKSRPGDPLVFVSAPGAAPAFLPSSTWHRMRGYCGDIAADRSGRFIAASSPRGGVAFIWDQASGRMQTIPMPDGCGLLAGPVPGQFVLSAGTGVVATIDAQSGVMVPNRFHEATFAWDNHLG
ncbi:MAG: DUF1513 domain-containing protein [Pseudomonadota bacterium]